MAISESVDQVDSDLETIVEELVDQKVQEKVEQRIAEREDELVERVDKLEAENERLRKQSSSAAPKTAINHLAEALTGAEIDDYSADPFQNRDAFEAFRQQVQTITEQVEDNSTFIDEWGEGETTDNDEAWYQIVQAAQNLHGNPNHTTDDGKHVVLYVDNLDQTLSYSYRYCVDLIEDWGDEKRGATWKPHVPKTAGENNKERRKRLLLDMDVWGEDGE